MKTLLGFAGYSASARMSAGLALPLWNMIQEAGGQVTDFTGNPLDLGKGGSVVGTNSWT